MCNNIIILYKNNFINQRNMRSTPFNASSTAPQKPYNIFNMKYNMK